MAVNNYSKICFHPAISLVRMIISLGGYYISSFFLVAMSQYPKIPSFNGATAGRGRPGRVSHFEPHVKTFGPRATEPLFRYYGHDPQVASQSLPVAIGLSI